MHEQILFSVRGGAKLANHNTTLMCTLERIDAKGLHVSCKTVLIIERESRQGNLQTTSHAERLGDTTT